MPEKKNTGPGVIRRSKRERRQCSLVGIFSERPRYNWMSRTDSRSEAYEADPRRGTELHTHSARRDISSPLCHVVVVPDLTGGQLTTHDREILSIARQLADDGQGAVLAVCMRDCADDLADLGCDLMVELDYRIEDRFSAETAVTALEEIHQTYRPKAILLPETVTGGDLGRRLAARTGLGVATGVWQVSEDHCFRRAGHGRYDQELEHQPVLLISPEAAAPTTAIHHVLRRLEPPTSASIETITDCGLETPDPGSISVAEADFIASAGNGVTEWKLFHQMASAVGAVEGASRAAVDSGHMPRERQIGSSGTIVSARFYLAFGISGAQQHLQGIQSCQHVISVNTQPSCDMMRRADLPIVADSGEVMRNLTAMTVLMKRND